LKTSFGTSSTQTGFILEKPYQRRKKILKEIELFVDTEEMADFVFLQLIKRGFAPSEKEVEEIADIMFDFMVHKHIIEEEEE
jgi:YozD-like protein